MSNFKGLYDIRDMQSDDKNFIMATFLRGLYYGDSWFSLIPKQIFMDNYKKFIENLLLSPKVTVKIACLKEDSSVIIGYSVLSSDFQTIHWTYVKSVWRERGIARSLLPKHPTTVTHLSKIGLFLLPKFPNAVFNPFNV
jgi:hypothetical protein